MVTLHDIGDKVWIMDNNKPIEVEIKQIRIDHIKNILYKFDLATHERLEHLVRETKEDLLKSL